ncbi:MAG: glycosyltransferase [Candidatus Poseidoniaceae archaeon]|nr:glycosyltransferase [Candidatus Poseidoniaceae archaeon]
MEAPARPVVVSVIPTFNEEKWISRCLDSLLEQTYPKASHRIHIIDGGSTDSTLDVIRQRLEKGVENEVSILENPHRFVPQARNISLESMKDDVELVFEVNAHGWVPEDHLEKRVADMLDIEVGLGKKVGGVGCKVLPSEDEEQGIFATWVESTLSCPLGSGGGQFARFRGRHPHKVPAFVIHRREALLDVDGWDENYPTNQDSDISMRLIKNGWGLWRSDASPFHMVKRRSLPDFVRMCRRYGFWRTKTLKRHSGRFNLREFLPLLGLVLTMGLLFSGTEWWYVPPLAYACALAVSAVFESSREGRLSLLIGIPLLLPILHTMFTIGLLEGLLRSGLSIKDR